MTDRHRVSAEFEASIGSSGVIALPDDVLKSLKGTARNVHVRLTANAVGSSLRKRGVDEEEIERISRMQLESREQVVKFLLSEGALGGKSRRRSG